MPVTLECHKAILEQMQNYICKIYNIENGRRGTGFFMNIPYKTKKIPVLITNYHIIDKEYIESNKTINITLNDGKNDITLELGNKRQTYFNKEYDTTIIEILPKYDNISFFLELEENILKGRSAYYYEKESIYIIQYPKAQNLSVSYGILNKIDNYNIYHFCCTENGSSGSPILSIKNQKVIGIHKKGNNNYRFQHNEGTFLKKPIEDFIDEYNNNNNDNNNNDNNNNNNINNNNININNNNNINNINNNNINNNNNDNNEINIFRKFNSSIFEEKLNLNKKINNNIKLNTDEIKIKYNIYNYKKECLRIFGSEFVNKNKNNCKLIYENKEFELKEFINIKNNKKEIIEIKLKGINKITDMSCLFKECNSLSSSTDLSHWDTSNITNMSYLFNKCDLLQNVPDISKWNISNVKYLQGMFKGCKSLKVLPDLSLWDTSNVMYMGGYFSDETSLNPLSDEEINKYNKNEYIISGMFYGCYSLSSLPDISNWNVSNVSDMSSMFFGCKTLSVLPDISKWNISKVNNMKDMFAGCNSLTVLPDISEWNTSNVTNMNGMFCGCISLSKLPDISKWNISNVTDMKIMFCGCKESLNIPPNFTFYK